MDLIGRIESLLGFDNYSSSFGFLISMREFEDGLIDEMILDNS